MAISAITTSPAKSLPTAKDILDFDSVKSFDSIRSLKGTALLSELGTSMPTALFPGIGASILISAAPRLNLISSASDTILLTLTPGAGVSSYLVTAGPFEQFAGSMETSTPNV